MANVDRPNGFRVVGHINGSQWNGQFGVYYSGTDNLFMGDLIEKDGTGVAIRDGAYPGAARAEADDIPVGVVVGWEPDPDSLGNLYHVASSTKAVYIVTDPSVVLEAQANDSGIAATDVGLNADFVVAAGSTTTGLSNMEIDGTTEVTTADEPLKILGAVDRMDNDLSSANARWLVMLNQHAYRSDAGTAGI